MKAAHKDREWTPSRDVVDATREFLPATGLDPRYIDFVANKPRPAPQALRNYLQRGPRTAIDDWFAES